MANPIDTPAAPTLFQLLIFGHRPALGIVIAYSLLLVGMMASLVLLLAMFCIWWERKVAGHIQSRLGPNRVGIIGILQSLADGIKLLAKEDLTPADADRPLFRLAPYLAFVPVFVAFAAISFAPDFTFEPLLGAGIFWILAVLSVEAMGIILAGWSSNNKWSIYGAIRQAGQMVSYEVPLGLSIVVGVMAAGALSPVRLGALQQGGIHTWLVFRNPFVFIAFFTFFVAALASNKRAPFDLPEAESELVAGFHTEYSGMRFAFFFFAEYAGMFVAGAIMTSLFLGAWNDPFGLIGFYDARWATDREAHVAALFALNLLAAGIFVLKVMALIFVQMWIRWTLPRPRIDQVLHTCIKVLLPLGCVAIMGSALWQLFITDMASSPASGTGLPWVDYNPYRFDDWRRLSATGALATQALLATFGVALFMVVIAWIGYAWLSGRQGVGPRLSPPAPIPLPGPA